MRTIALGMLVATGVFMALPANADEVRVGVGPAGVSVGEHHDHAWRRRHEHVTVGYAHRDCKTVIIHERGITKKIRRCR